MHRVCHDCVSIAVGIVAVLVVHIERIRWCSLSFAMFGFALLSWQHSAEPHQPYVSGLADVYAPRSESKTSQNFSSSLNRDNWPSCYRLMDAAA